MRCFLAAKGIKPPVPFIKDVKTGRVTKEIVIN
jgi:hypothetical protein